MAMCVLSSTLTLRHPIVQAAMPGCDGVRLPAAVSRAGGLGTLSIHGLSPAATTARLTRLRTLMTHPVLIAFTAEWERQEVLEVCVAQGMRNFQVCWWNGERLAPRIRKTGSTVFWQVGTVEQAAEALAHGADVLVAQGTEAGGQVRSPYPVRTLVRMLRAQFGSMLPVIAGGGLADRADVCSVLDAGATAALLGTRFALSEEAIVSPRAKARLLQATAAELLLDTRLLGSWPCAPRRRLPTATDPDTSELFAGLGLDRITRLLPAGALVRTLSPHADERDCGR